MKIYKKKYIYIMILMIITLSLFYMLNKKGEIKLDKIEIKESNSNHKTFAMYKEISNGEYELYNEDVFPSHHTLNLEKSKCIDNDGSEIESILLYDNANYKVIINTDKTVYCYLFFDVSEYIITFNSNGGNEITDQIIIRGSEIGTLPILTKGNDYFAGWYLEDTFENKVDNTYVPNSNITLYARWYEYVDMNLFGRSRGYPSSTATDLRTKRTWNVSTYVTHWCRDNYMTAGTFFTNFSVSNPRLSVTGSCGYGLGFPMILDKNYSYFFTRANYSNAISSVSFYASDGTFLSFQIVDHGSIFTIPSNAYWTVYGFSSGSLCGNDALGYIDNPKLYKVN